MAEREYDQSGRGEYQKGESVRAGHVENGTIKSCFLHLGARTGRLVADAIPPGTVTVVFQSIIFRSLVTKRKQVNVIC